MSKPNLHPTRRLSSVAGRDVTVDGWPSVAVVMPIRDEADHLNAAVESVLSQQYPGEFTVCLAVAPSSDGTEAIAAELASRHDAVSVVANPTGITPAGLNSAIAATTSDIVVRVDGHSVLSPDYIERAVRTQIETGAVNVGGRQVPIPETPFESAVAEVTSSWLGTGGANYRVGGEAGPVDTVYLGVFDRAAGDEVGWFDVDLIRNQDYELNIRLRAAGGTIWFDPDLWVGYRPRPDFRSLARQYFEYGVWKAEVLRRHPDSLRVRQVVPLAPLVATLLAVLGIIGRRRVFAVPLIGYLGVLTVASKPPPLTRLVVALTIHLSWATGLVRGLVAGTPR